MNHSSTQDTDYDVWTFRLNIMDACPDHKKNDLDQLFKQMNGDEDKIVEKIQEWWGEEPAQLAQELSWEAVDKKKSIKKKRIVSGGGGSGDRRDHASREDGNDSASGRGGVRNRGVARKGAVKFEKLKPPPPPQPSVITGVDTATILSKQQPMVTKKTDNSNRGKRKQSERVIDELSTNLNANANRNTTTTVSSGTDAATASSGITSNTNTNVITSSSTSSSSWTCIHCTYDQENGDSFCELCGSMRSGIAILPNEVSLSTSVPNGALLLQMLLS